MLGCDIERARQAGMRRRNRLVLVRAKLLVSVVSAVVVVVGIGWFGYHIRRAGRRTDTHRPDPHDRR
ncbi:hypothetical protein I552_4354 [Mycobacterium xenopi 3993]|nr:hypothetical protein I552_4354 [Mycobacterium xenopi 3993]